jgi:hypothetical protein
MIAAVKRFWDQAGLPTVLIEGREHEICAAAYDGDELVAVSTAALFYDPSMRNKLFGYRCMVAPQVRQQNVAWKISAFSLKILQNWSAQHPEEHVLGLMICVETDKFETGLRKPVREKLGFTMHFVGYTAAGQQLRVVWFDHAELDDQAVRPL